MAYRGSCLIKSDIKSNENSVVTIVIQKRIFKESLVS